MGRWRPSGRMSLLAAWAAVSLPAFQAVAQGGAPVNPDGARLYGLLEVDSLSGLCGIPMSGEERATFDRYLAVLRARLPQVDDRSILSFYAVGRRALPHARSGSCG